MIGFARQVVAWLRGVTGDDAYDRYLEHHARAHPDRPPLSRKEFFDEQLAMKWSGGVNRCC